MTRSNIHLPDARLDLVLERIVDVPTELVWIAWTTPEHIKRWFTPAPWTTVDCEIDLRPGGIFRTVMRSPEGQEFPNVGCYLEVIENKKLVWTNALGPGYRPSNQRSKMPCDTISRKWDEVHGTRHPWGRRGPQETRGTGVPRRLGEGSRSARCPRQENVSIAPRAGDRGRLTHALGGKMQIVTMRALCIIFSTILARSSWATSIDARSSRSCSGVSVLE